MRSTHLLLCVGALALSSCGVGKLFRPSPEQQLSRLVARHPELQRTDTVMVHDTITVPTLQVETRFVFTPNVVRERADSLQLDSLLQKLETSLDTAKRRATTREVFRYIRAERPRFPDTLCFDTLGLRGKVWRTGSAYRISLMRKEIRQPHTAKAVVATLHPCDCATTIWYDPRTWPWLWVLAGFVAGNLLCFTLARR